MKKNKKRKGSIELYYIIIIISLLTSIVISFNFYYRNIINLNSFTKNINNEIIYKNNINTEIAKSIQKKTYEELKKVDDYNINIVKLTNNLNSNNYKKIIKDYSMISVNTLNSSEELILTKQENSDCFLFSDSLSGLIVGYSKNSNDYIIGDINNVFYYGIEKSINNMNSKLYINSKENNSKLIFAQFDSNSISQYDFFIAKIQKNEKIYYTIYMETYLSIIEIYSF